MGPGRSGPDPHFHRTISESFLVLTGTVRLHACDRSTPSRVTASVDRHDTYCV